ncbi:hypothetical protein T439DRAFT_321513 [Meredithblackwellia eburnea MCA 4105]
MMAVPAIINSFILALVLPSLLEPPLVGRRSRCSRESVRSFGFGVTTVRAQSVLGRWSQSSALLSPGNSPTFVIVSGKQSVSGQTVDSSPTISSTLSLSLASPILDLSSPNWIVSSTGPLTAYGSSIPLSSTTILAFGGDASGSSTEPVQSANDSAWVGVFTTSTASPTWTHEPANWANEPVRRERAFATSASDGSTTRAWVFGGMKADGSGTAFDELWEFNMGISPSGAISVGSGWTMWTGSNSPPAMYDGVAVLVPSSTGDLPSIYFIGGVQVSGGSISMASLSTIWVFTPTSTFGEGSWQQVSVSGSPSGRRGHVAVFVGNGKIWVQGGRGSDDTQILSDGAILDTVAKRWTSTAAGGPTAWGHSAVLAGEVVALAFGYGANAALPSQLYVYAPGNDTWLSSFYPSSFSSSSSSGRQGGSSVDTWTLPGAPVATSTSSQGSSNGSGASTKNVGGTTVKATNSPTGAPTSGDHKSSEDSSKVIGGAVGGVLGFAVVAAGAAFLLIRRRRRRTSYYSRRGRGRGPRPKRYEDGSGSLMAEHSHRRSDSNVVVEQATPVALRNLGKSPGFGGGVRQAFAGLFGHSSSPSTARFDMLRDEETDRWDSTRGRQGWETFDGEDGSTPDLHGRGGMGVWSGFGSSPDLAGSDTVQSKASFLTGALGGFTASPAPEQRRLFDDREEREDEGADLGRQGADGLDPIHEDDMDDSSSSGNWRGSVATESADQHSASTHETSSPSTTSKTSAPTLGHVSSSMTPSPSQPFSPITSLHGSLFTQPTSTPRVQGPRAPTTSGGSSQLTRNSSWWNRLSRPPSEDVSTRIRDPAPAPMLDAISETATDPFADPQARAVDEHGRLLGHGKRNQHEHSLSSNATLDTINSTMLEERMRDMVVVQREQTGSISESETSSISGHGFAGHGFGPLPLASGSDANHDVEGTPGGPGSVVFTGATVFEEPEEFEEDGGDEVARDSNITPKTRQLTARQPLATPPFTQPSPSPTSRRTSGVRALVQQIETRQKTISEGSGAPASPSYTPPSVLPGNVRRQTMEFERPQVKTPSPVAVRVAHGLAKKPVLYVANPDDADNASQE